MRHRIAVIATVLVLAVGSDQAVKQIAGTFLRNALPVSLLHDFIRLQYAENRGIMLSIGAALSAAARFWIFVVGLGVLLIGMLAYVILNRTLDRVQTIAWSLIVSGGLGNLLDRVTRDGVVIDYVSIGVGFLRTAVFNIADLLVFAGVFLLVVHGTKKNGNPVREAPHEQAGGPASDVKHDPLP